MKRLSHLITPEKITIEFCKECIPGAPWGATNATVNWTGAT